MRYPLLLCLLYLAICISCNSSSSQETVHETSPSNLTCDSLLLSLLKSTTFNKEPGDPIAYSCRIDKKTANSLLVKAFVPRNSGQEGTLGWLLIDFEQQALMDVSFDPDNPLYLDFDKLLFKEYTKGCF